ASITALILFSAKKLDFDPLLKLLICAGAAGFGYLIPDIVVKNTAKKRQQTIIKAFPDALDLIVICVEAGISLEQAFVRVSHEMAEMAPILSEEFGITTA